VDLLVVQGAVALPQIRAGKIKALANPSATRSASMLDIPTAEGRDRKMVADHQGRRHRRAGAVSADRYG
jgi:hypothetical protein